MSVLALENIHCSFKRGEPVLAGVDLEIESGQVVGLLGRNGAGKTTLLHIAMGMLRQQQGSVEVFGLDPHRRPLEVKRRVGYVSEDQIMPAFLRVHQVLELHRGLCPSWDEQSVFPATGR
jgi:ABC-2 type transport system ATP-binding protein